MLQPIDPDRTLQFDEYPRLAGVVLAPEPDRAFAQVNVDAVNIWSVIVYFWPEMLGTACVISMLILAASIWRIFRRVPRLPGVPYCRSCNYRLDGLALNAPHARCPECGHALTSRRAVALGKSRSRRLAPAFLACGVFLLIGAILGILQVGRVNGLSHAFTWLSASLYTFADKSGWASISSQKWPAHRILEFDLRPGSLPRCLAVVEGWAVAPITVTPDGRWLLVPARDFIGIHQIDAQTGIHKRTLLPEATSPNVPEFARIAGVSDDSRMVWTSWLDETNRQVEVWRFDLSTGKRSRCFSLPAETHGRAGGGTVRAPDIRRVPTESGVFWLEAPNGYGVDSDDHSDLRVRPDSSPELISSRFSVRVPPFYDMSVNATDSTVCIVDEDDEVRMFDLRSGAQTALLNTSDAARLHVDPLRNLLFVFEKHFIRDDRVVVWNLATSNAIATLRLPRQPQLIDQMQTSADGSLLMIHGHSFNNSPNFQSQIYLFELSSLSAK